jgi:hypothetical protein
VASRHVTALIHLPHIHSRRSDWIFKNSGLYYDA